MPPGDVAVVVANPDPIRREHKVTMRRRRAETASGAKLIPGERIFVALGGNLGDVFSTMRGALQDLRRWPHTQVVAVSWLYRTAPVDADGPDFLNGVVELRSSLAPQALLNELLKLEAVYGRHRDSLADARSRGTRRHASRTLDLDLLMVGDRHVDTSTLQLPHPRMHERAFVLAPLADVAPDLRLADGRAVGVALAGAPLLDMQRLVPLEAN